MVGVDAAAGVVIVNGDEGQVEYRDRVVTVEIRERVVAGVTRMFTEGLGGDGQVEDRDHAVTIEVRTANDVGVGGPRVIALVADRLIGRRDQARSSYYRVGKRVRRVDSKNNERLI